MAENTMYWDFLGAGNFNNVYVNSERTLVLKIKKPATLTGDSAIDEDTRLESPLDRPMRSVRIWNQINPGLNPPAVLASTELGLGWVAPFVSGTQASDAEIAEKSIDIYNRTGRIVVDAISKGNFIKTSTGKIVCVDIGMALQTEMEEEKRFLYGTRVRRKSIVSSSFWEKNSVLSRFQTFYQTHSATYPQSISTIRALLFIKKYRPDIVDVSFLTENSALKLQLAAAFSTGEESAVRGAKVALDISLPISVNQMRLGCIKQAENYIASRGVIDVMGNF